MRDAGRVGDLAFGLFLLLLGVVVASTGTGSFFWAGWISIAFGAILLVAHVAVGPRRTADGARVE